MERKDLLYRLQDFRENTGHSVFRRTFLSIFCALLCVALLFALLMHQMALQNMRESIHGANTHLLQKTAALVDSALESTLDNVELLSRDPVIVNTAVVPDPSQSQRNFQSVTLLKSFLDRESYISSIALLTTYDDTVYTPPGDIVPLAQHPGSALFSQAPVLTFPHRRSQLVRQGEATYLRLSFLPGYQGELGILLLELDMEALCADLCGQLPGLAILAGQAPLFPTASSPDLSPDPADRICLSWISQDSGLEFFYAYPQPVLGPGLSGGLNPLGLLAGVVPLLALIALLVAWRYYRPLNALLRTSLDLTSLPQHDDQNEWTILRRAIGSIDSQNKRFQELVSLAAPDIQRRVLADLLEERAEKGEELEHTLAGIKSPLTSRGLFAVFVILDPSTGAIDDVPLRACLSRLERLQIRDLCLVALPYLYTVVVLVQFRRTPEADVDALKNLGNILKLHSAPLPQACLGCSGFFYSLYGLHDAYELAYVDAVQSTPAAPDPRASLQTTIQQTVSNLPEQPPEVGELTLRRLCQRLFDSQYGPSQLQEHAAWLTEAMGQLGRSFHLESPAAAPDGQTAQQAQEYAHTLLTGIYEVQKRRQNRYLVDAVEYLKSHYMDPELSLKSVAEQVGINDSYLSKLFNSAYQKGFGEYLNQVRTERAKELLLDGRLRILDISRQTGFLSVQSFTRAFKRQVGCTPGEYRRICAEADKEKK